MKPLRLSCLLVIFISTMVLAQSSKGAPVAQRQPTSAGAWTAFGARPRRRNAKPQVQGGPEQVLYAFQGGNDGGLPYGGLIFDSSGNLYGTTYYGGGGACTGSTPGCGTVFELSSNGGGGWKETLLYSFQGGSDGEYPSSGLIFDQSGNLYGTTSQGGANGCNPNYGCGTVFELSPNGGGGWTETTLYSFQGTSGDGMFPEAGVIFDRTGNLYGTTLAGGEHGCGSDNRYDCGTVFELSPNRGGGWTETLLYSFPPAGYSDGFGPNAGLILDQSGNLYGTAQGGTGGCIGSNGCGTVFELSPNGSSGGWKETVLYSFQGTFNGGDGAFPDAGVILDQAGNLYGTTSQGGANGCNPNYGCGTVFELSPNGGGGWTETTLYSFQGTSGDGMFPEAGVIFDRTGNLYGTTSAGGTWCYGGCGTVFELSPNGGGGWTETILYSLQGGGDGAYPYSGLIFDQSGNLYGTTLQGGGTGCNLAYGCGTVFEVSREPFVTFSPTSLNFGNQTVGITSSPLNVTLTNTGNINLTITSIQVTGANSGDFAQTNNCPASVAPNGSCQITVTFTPTAAGTRNAAVTITDNAPGSPQSVPLTGVGVLPAVTFSPTSLTFPNQVVFTTSPAQQVTLTDTGLGILKITAGGISGQFGGTTNCGNTLAPGASCTIKVVFKPQTKGPLSGAITVNDNAPGSPQKVPLSGTGTYVQLSPKSLNFGNQPVGTTSLPKYITLTNKGDVAVNISNISITGANAGDFAQKNNCGNSVASGASCFIKVTFTPSQQGKRTAAVSISDDGGGSPQTVPLTGTGTP